MTLHYKSNSLFNHSETWNPSDAFHNACFANTFHFSCEKVFCLKFQTNIAKPQSLLDYPKEAVENLLRALRSFRSLEMREWDAFGGRDKKKKIRNFLILFDSVFCKN